MTKLKKLFKNLFIIGLVAFILQYAWESLVCDLFYTMSATTNYVRLLTSATFGDVNMTLGLYILLSFVNKNLNWFLNKWGSKEYTIFILYSLFFSFYFEISALYLGRWSYSNEMPLFPNTNIGLVPIFQLFLLFPLTFFISKLIIKRIKR